MGGILGDGGGTMNPTDTSVKQTSTQESSALLPWHLVGAVAIICGIVLAMTALLGPAGTGDIQYRTSQSTLLQTEGADIVNLVLIAPILLVGGVLELLRRSSARYFLILTPIALMYTGFSVGIGQEWGNPAYTGNSEQYSWLFMVMIIGGLMLLVASISMFGPADAPKFGRRSLRIYVGVMCLLLVLFAVMWLSEMVQVISSGDLPTGGYSEAPVVWWTIRYLDLGFTIPFGFLALFLLLNKPARAYPLVLLFFGFFVTMGSSVLSMGLNMTLSNDPQSQPGSLVVFGGLAALSWVGLLYLVKDKVKSALVRQPDLTAAPH